MADDNTATPDATCICCLRSTTLGVLDYCANCWDHTLKLLLQARAAESVPKEAT